MTAKENFISEIRLALPPVFARDAVGRLTGGLISPRTLANLDSLGKGPRQRVRVGRKVAYSREAFISWLESRMEIIE
ncbi:MAG: hypothetical protein AB7E47_07800 [Desulfovibrionaceae bacterium]